jgi:hypothetical protein
MLTGVLAACEYQPCGRLSGEYSPVFSDRCASTLAVDAAGDGENPFRQQRKFVIGLWSSCRDSAAFLIADTDARRG